LLGQREKISERPYQVRAFYKIRLYVSRPDWRIQFKNAIGEFFNPHILVLAHLKETAHSAFALKAGHYCTKDRAMGSNLFVLKGNFFPLSWINLRKGPGRRAGIEHDQAAVR